MMMANVDAVGGEVVMMATIVGGDVFHWNDYDDDRADVTSDVTMMMMEAMLMCSTCHHHSRLI